MYKALKNKKIVLAVSGGIACYKSIFLARLLIKEGADIHVVMTENATKFITPLTFQAITSNHVWIEEWDSTAHNNMAHINLTRDIDLLILAPATANTIAKITHGIADNLLCSMILACVKNIPILIAPAMNIEMLSAPATIRNIQQLKQDGYIILEPNSGEQACGEIGVGRMAEPEEIIQDITYHLTAKPLKGKNIVITAGATQEYIDPVRYITNASSGKMGLALARQAYYMGANVILVYGCIDKNQPNTEFLSKIKIIKVTSADEMYNAVMNIYDKDNNFHNQIFIGVAAVSDWTVENISLHKQKKDINSNNNNYINNISLVKTKDILASVSTLKHRPFCIGFAAETQNLLEYAQTKLHSKNLDLIIANLISDGFAKDTNKVYILSKNHIKELEEMDKDVLACNILNRI